MDNKTNIDLERAHALLEANFSTSTEEAAGLCLRLDNVINPADVRKKAAEILSSSGYRGYELKEAYSYEASKTPFRTDQYGYVEFVPLEHFKFDQAQARVQNLNRVQVKILPGSTPKARES
jgi:hypothetical protein